MIKIRTMTEEDLAAIEALETACFTVAWSEDLIQDAYENTLDHIWVAELEEEVVGYLDFRVIAGEGELMRIAVLPRCQGQGIGKLLMDRLNEDAEQNQVEAVTLEVRASNEKAIRLYESYGFEKEAVRARYYTHPVEDAYILWRRK